MRGLTTGDSVRNSFFAGFVLTCLFPAVITIFSQTASAGSEDDGRLEPILDELVKSNFNNDFVAASRAFLELIDTEKRLGIEPSGKLAVVQVQETREFAGKLESRVRDYIERGYPVLAHMELARFLAPLGFEPSGALRARAMSEMVDEAGRELCAKLRSLAGSRTAVLSAAVCKVFENGTESGGFGQDPVGPPLAGVDIEGTVKGFPGAADFGGLVEGHIRKAGLAGPEGQHRVSLTVGGTVVSSVSCIPDSKPVEYGVKIPYSEMREYCDWKEETTTRTVVEDGVTKRLTEKTRTCVKSQKPVDLYRIEKRFRAVSGRSCTKSTIWQIPVEFDDGAGCAGRRTFSDRMKTVDFEHSETDAAIGLKPDPLELPDDNTTGSEIAGRIAQWIVKTESECLSARWCSDLADEKGIDLENALVCAGISGTDPGAVDAIFISRFGVTLKELLNFLHK